MLQNRNQRIALGVILGVLVLGGIGLLVLGGGDDPPPPTTTTTTTTTTVPSTTTTAPPTAPLTGSPVADPAVLQQVALVVKIDNVEPKARPQVGINQADVVFEERVEGSVTRLLAVFHSTASAPVGPVRSARTTDIGILSMLRRPYFAWSGANPAFAERVRAANINDVGYDVATGLYYRDPGRPAPHNLMLKSTTEAQQQPHPGSTPPTPLFTYRTPEKGTRHLEQFAGARVTYGSSAGAAPVEYRWNGKGWARTQKGTPHVDAAGVQVAPENVVIQFVDYVPTDVLDQFGVRIPEAQLVGEGDAWILTNGGRVSARWKKPSIDAVTTYTNVDGEPVLLTPGRTWVALPPKGEATPL